MLKPCPFCGKQPRSTIRPKIRYEAQGDEKGYIAFRACHGDGYSAHAHVMGVGDTDVEANASADLAWNTRHDDGGGNNE